MGMASRGVASAIDSNYGTVQRYLRQTGGIAPPQWKDPDRLLTLEERFRIKELLVEGHSLRHIGRVLGRSASTISREVKRGSDSATRSHYRPSQGHRISWERRRRPKELKIVANPHLRTLVQAWLEEKLSPEQIVGRLRREHPDDRELHVSHETIYKTIYLQARGGLKRDLQALTRTGRTIRHPQRSTTERRGRIKGMVSIWDRPAEALDRAVPGHWEGDLIVGKNGASAIATIVERHSNYLILVRLDPDKNRVEATRDGLIDTLAGLPNVLKGSLTWDQGKEMANHLEIATMAGIDIYFADPHSPWQRATNENTNGLLRQYFPKGTDLSIHSQDDLDYVADQMNRRPRKRLDFATPYETMQETLLQ
ncbi:IS30 family transposase [Demequina sp.]|uniref:IS30 family transposase n=1 Tax=Demequina sp. TaxID=2050685 RepID=UPI003D0BAFBF